MRGMIFLSDGYSIDYKTKAESDHFKIMQVTCL